MKEKVASLETKMALLQSDINTIKNREPQLPGWLRNSAIIVLMAMFGQIVTAVWWASSMTANLEHINNDVGMNTEFRISYPKMHAETMVSLHGLKKDSEHTGAMVKDIKSKLKFIDIKDQRDQRDKK